MNNLSHLQKLTPAQYAGKIRKFGNLEKIFEEKLDFDNFVYNSYLHYLDCGDVIHLNRVLDAALHLNRYREIASILRLVTAHKWTKGPSARLEMNSRASKKKMAHLRQHGENEFLMAFGEEQKKQSTSKEWDLEKRFASFLKQAEKHGFSYSDVFSLMHGEKSTSVDTSEKRKAG